MDGFVLCCVLWPITSLRINVEQRWMIYERKICLAAGRDGSRYAVEQMSEAKNEEFILCSTSDSSKARIPENRVRKEEKKITFRRRSLENENSFLYGISLHDSLPIFCARASRDCEASHFQSNLLLRMEFFEGEERLTFDINESKLESWIHRSLINCWKNLKRLDFSSRVVRKLILRVLGFTSFSRSLPDDDVFRSK